MATAEHADAAVRAAQRASADWWTLGAERRAEFLRPRPQIMRRRRFELAAWRCYECGKAWREADGDVGEAIDFCEYYAAGAHRPGRGRRASTCRARRTASSTCRAAWRR